ncbi:hypothetical protein ITI46_23135 [Streptomyces oryzae]|uniref:Uncharacterized protein n=1 Tax=Streptomyces oryzae TaxID=1434886 RepID=A0ABS3XGW5_9ACTN|nr:hypothetical protein [Streptomyces oryzae]MBO8194529.1 hypothetical protein [Streptomyces oryzae]
MPIHRDTLARTRELQANAAAAGRSRAADGNARLATAVEHLIAHITDQERDELSPVSGDYPGGRDKTERGATAG